MFIRFPVDRPSEVLNRQAGGSIGWLDNSFAHFILKIRVNPFTLEITRLKKVNGLIQPAWLQMDMTLDLKWEVYVVCTCMHCTLYI